MSVIIGLEANPIAYGFEGNKGDGYLHTALGCEFEDIPTIFLLIAVAHSLGFHADNDGSRQSLGTQKKREGYKRDTTYISEW